MTIRSAMVLAAGKGTRMRPLTDKTPKPLLKVAGVPMIDRVLELVLAAGLSRAVVNLHYLGDQIRAHLESRDNPEIAFSDEGARLLETGGGVRKALPLLGPDPFITINSDAVWKGDNPIAHLLSAWHSDRMDALMLLVPRERAVAYTRPGDFFLAGMTPSRRGPADRAPFVYTGCQIIRPLAFDDAPLGPFSTNLIWDRLISAKRLAATVYDGAWVDVGTPDGLDHANRLLGERE